MSSKAREALVKIGNISAFVKTEFPSTAKYMNDIISIVQAALDEQPRNCDIGTPEELSVRMAEFCREQYEKSDGIMLCSGCRFHGLEGLDCQFAWAQMPYEKGKTDEQ